jgi:hypothetical protein
VDEDIPTEKQKSDRKPWFVALTQKPDRLQEVGGVRGLPDGNTLLLTEYEVVELVRYLFEPQTAVWSDTPTVTEPGMYYGVLFLQPGMLDVSDAGDIVNGEAQWSPECFRRQESLGKPESLPTRKLHTLPWKLPSVGKAR